MINKGIHFLSFQLKKACTVVLHLITLSCPSPARYLCSDFQLLLGYSVFLSCSLEVAPI